MAYVFRGVSAKHPEWFIASMGVVVPGDPAGTISAYQHNKGDMEELSPYTSWTYNRATAEFHRDKDGPGGLLLRVEAIAPEEGDEWSWEWSPDIYFEEEILMKGIRMGIEVIV